MDKMGKSFDITTTVLEKSVAGKKLKIKILAKKPANGIGVGHISEQVAEVNCVQRLSLTDDRMQNTAVNKKVYSDMGKPSMNGSSQFLKVNCQEKSFLFGHHMKSACDNENHETIVRAKRGSEVLLDYREGKRLKMDCIAASRCQNILLKLMKHKFAKPFLDPVNPTEWGIPDYFDIVKHPMDLGTIKKKLHRNAYGNAEEFEADVRLTFSNAMLYNPSNNWVHQHAKRLGEIFDSDWKAVKAILFRGHKNIMKKRAEDGTDKIACDVRGKNLEGNSSNVVDVPRNKMLHKDNGSEDLKIASFEMWRSDLRVVKDHESKGSNQLRSIPHSAGSVSRWDKESACSMPTKATCGNTNGVKAPNESNLVEVINISTAKTTRSDQDSEGNMSCLDEEHAGASIPITAGSVGSTTQSLDTVLDMELSPSKALRAAKLRSRFADTILKAQNKTLLQPGGIKDAASLEQEKERLVRKQQEERARIEAQVRAADLTARLKAEDERKKQRQQAREAARAALEKMERSINLDDNFHTLRDLEALIGSSSLVVCHDGKSHRVWSPLERLGLYIKAEYRVGDDDDDVLLREIDLEEGEYRLET